MILQDFAEINRLWDFYHATVALKWGQDDRNW